MSAPLFGSGGNATGSSGGNRHLVEFRAGRMNLADKLVKPDTRKGLVYLYQAEDGLIHFCWQDRTSGTVEDDLIIFPDDCEFLRVESCKTGRVYVLKFKSSTRRLFFWLQEAKTDKDEEWCRRVNDIMNNPPSASSSRSGEGGDLQYMLNNMSQQQLMQLFGGVGPMRGLGSLLGSMNNTRSPRVPAAATLTPVPAIHSIASPTTPINQSIPVVTPQAPRATRLSTSGVHHNLSTGEDLATAIQNAIGAGTPSGTSEGDSNNLLDIKNFMSDLEKIEADGSNARDVDMSSATGTEVAGRVASDADRIDDPTATVETGDSSNQPVKDAVASEKKDVQKDAPMEEDKSSD